MITNHVWTNTKYNSSHDLYGCVSYCGFIMFMIMLVKLIVNFTNEFEVVALDVVSTLSHHTSYSLSSLYNVCIFYWNTISV